ncbi:MAG: hypothetical protein FWD32_00085 [Firmicutes bacterium]|nr:hypothetical protein [Bacillota bacterium]
MKKIVSLILILCFLTTGFLTTVLLSRNNASARNNIAAASIGPGTLPEPSIPVDIENCEFRAADGSKLGYVPTKDLEGNIMPFGIIVDANNNPVYSAATGDAIMYDGREQQLYNRFKISADKALELFIDSKNDYSVLKHGTYNVSVLNGEKTVKLENTKTVVKITPQSAIYLIGVKVDGQYRQRWAFSDTTKRDWWKFWEPETTTRFYDLNGFEIKQELIEAYSVGANQLLLGLSGITLGVIGGVILTAGIATANPFLFVPAGIVMAVGGYLGLQAIVLSDFIIYAETTFEVLVEYVTYARHHPWDTLVDEFNRDVTDEDGNVVYINPRTMQLTNFHTYPLYDISNKGLPIFYNAAELAIMTTDGKDCTVVNGVLKNSRTIYHLLESGEGFFMATTTNQYGTFDVPVKEAFTDSSMYGVFVSLTGATIAIDNQVNSQIQNGQGIEEWLSSISGGLNSFFADTQNVINFIIILGIFILGLIALFIILSLLKRIKSILE